MSNSDDLAQIARLDGRYGVEALRLVANGLRRAAERTGKTDPDAPDRHLHARDLIDGILDLACEHWSLLALPLLQSWGVHKPRDFGEITFLFIEHHIFSKRDEDVIEDFDSTETLEQALVRLLTERFDKAAA